MAESLVTVGFAANLLQFVQFEVEVTSKAKEMLVSASGASEENIQLETLLADFEKHQSEVAHGLQASGLRRGHLTETKKAIGKLGQQCAPSIEELRESLLSLKLPTDSECRTKKATWAALKTSWKRSEC